MTLNPLPIGLTMGDPAGIGPELLLRLLSRLPAGLCGKDLTIYGQRTWLDALAHRFGLPFIAPEIEIIETTQVPAGLALGQVDARAGDAAFQSVARAAQDAMAGRLRAIVTAPLHKAAMNLAGHHYPGHTEILAELAGNRPVRMMLANAELRTVLVSIHLPLLAAVQQLNSPDIVETIQLTDAFLKRSGIAKPRIAVAGLNPHAGEDGLLGDEEIRIIAPAVRLARQQGIDASGPWPPDTVYMQARGFRRFDVVIAMYHDQGLIPVKYLGLDEGVNVTVGLPYVRTSPDHGTAFDIAPAGRADPASLTAALVLADQLSRAPGVTG